MPPDLFDEPPRSDGTVTTSSRFRTWWLRFVRGYRLESTHRLPRESLLGQLYYKTQWVLSKKR